MNQEHWQRVNDVFHLALERDAADREAFVREAAGGDAELFNEVRSLLASHDRHGGFLEDPAWTVAAEMILEEDSLTGRMIGRYRVLEEVGRGGMGIVYAAEDTRLGRTVALKALPREYSHDPVRRERLLREAKAAAVLSHPSIATVFELDEVDGDLYLISELVRGRTLRSEIADGPLPPDRLLPTLIDIASGLAAAHAAGIVHRDLKPENIVRRSDGQIKILDFGLARSEPTTDQPTRSRLTKDGTALGTPGYMAPEQLSGQEVDARADVFSFGVTAWECATGEHPFGSDTAALLQRMTELLDGRTPADLSRMLPIHGLNIILRRCMRGTSADRYPSAEPLLRDLQVLVGPRQPPPEPEMATGLWWWQFHQAAVAIVNASMPVAAWFVRRWAPTFGTMVFFAVLALATLSVTFRLHLLFTSRVNKAALARQRERTFTLIAGVETVLAGLLLVGAALVAGPYDAMAALLVTLAIVTLVSLAVIEPATTKAAGLSEGP